MADHTADEVLCSLEDRRTVTSLIIKFLAVNFTYIFALCRMFSLRGEQNNYARIVWFIICPFVSFRQSIWPLLVVGYYCACEMATQPWEDAKKNMRIYLSIALGYYHLDYAQAPPETLPQTATPSRWNLVPTLVIAAQSCTSIKLFVNRQRHGSTAVYDVWILGIVLSCLCVCLQTVTILLARPIPVSEAMSKANPARTGTVKDSPQPISRIEEWMSEIWTAREAVNTNGLIDLLKWNRSQTKPWSIQRFVGTVYAEVSSSAPIVVLVAAGLMIETPFPSPNITVFTYTLAILTLIPMAAILHIPIWWGIILVVAVIYKAIMELLGLFEKFKDQDRPFTFFEALGGRIFDASQSVVIAVPKFMLYYPMACLPVLVSVCVGIFYRTLCVELSAFANWPITTPCPQLWKDPSSDNLWSLA